MTQPNFLIAENEVPEISISGLTYIPDFITTEEHKFLLSQIDQQPWLTDLKRRVQHSFVSVTQHFNTDTSMGRLILNILQSFAQFEREMTNRTHPR